MFVLTKQHTSIGCAGGWLQLNPPLSVGTDLFPCRSVCDFSSSDTRKRADNVVAGDIHGMDVINVMENMRVVDGIGDMAKDFLAVRR